MTNNNKTREKTIGVMITLEMDSELQEIMKKETRSKSNVCVLLLERALTLYRKDKLLTPAGSKGVVGYKDVLKEDDDKAEGKRKTR